MPQNEGKQFLVILSILPANPTRLSTLVPALKSVLEQISIEPIEQLFRSATADCFGFLIRSRMNPAQIIAIIQSPQKHPWQKNFQPVEPFFAGQDHIAVIEIGSDNDATQGFSRALTWIRRH